MNTYENVRLAYSRWYMYWIRESSADSSGLVLWHIAVQYTSVCSHPNPTLSRIPQYVYIPAFCALSVSRRSGWVRGKRQSRVMSVSATVKCLLLDMEAYRHTTYLFWIFWRLGMDGAPIFLSSFVVRFHAVVDKNVPLQARHKVAMLHGSGPCWPQSCGRIDSSVKVPESPYVSLHLLFYAFSSFFHDLFRSCSLFIDSYFCFMVWFLV